MKYESDSEPIIPVSFDQRVHLENFVVIVEAEGFDPYKAGQTTQFTEEKFNSVLAVLKAQFKLGKLGGLVLSAPLLLTGVLLGVLQVFLCI